MTLPNVVFVLGGPGAGKGTQCQLIVEKFGYVHLSAGDLLRAERKKANSDVGLLIEKHIQQGTIVPVEITCGLLAQAMKENMTADATRDRFLIDGFPRNQDNMEGWNREMSEKSKLQFILFFDCGIDTCIERCLMRGEAGSGRSDDNMESLKKRVVTYEESTKPIIDHYNKLGLVRQISAAGSPTEVFAEVQKVFEAVQRK